MPPPPPAPEVHSEEWLLRQQLPPPRFGILSAIAYDPKKSGSAPFDPEKLKPYEMSSLRRRYGSYQGSNDALPNFVGPVVHDRPLFLERDDHLDLFNKVYMPLSQATRQHGVQFSVACETHHLEGVEDMSVCTVDGGSHRTTMIVEEKSENKFGHLFGDNILDKAVEGRNFNIAGLREAKNSANFQSALVLAQALGYMGSKGLIHGIIITARRAFLYWSFLIVKAPESAAVPPEPKQQNNYHPIPIRVDKSYCQMVKLNLFCSTVNQAFTFRLRFMSMIRIIFGSWQVSWWSRMLFEQAPDISSDGCPRL